MNRKIAIMGTRGIPASHGGFETFAEKLAFFLVDKGWQVTVYCQKEGLGKISDREWNGIRLVNVPVKGNGGFSTIIFDLKAILHSLANPGIILTLGYNSAVLNLIHKMFQRVNVINMDGIEWKREKWSKSAKIWFWLNERIGCWVGSCLIADHPEIAAHLKSRSSSSKKIEMIPYGGMEFEKVDENILVEYGLTKDEYSLLVARPEPENLILQVVRAYSSQMRGRQLVILGNYDPKVQYHKSVLDAASDEVVFLGPIYDQGKVGVLRSCARFYVHGHTVGGTNPSLVESIATGSAILAHDNKFNRWVAKDGGEYFSDENNLSQKIDELYSNDALVVDLRVASNENYDSNFRWDQILSKYESVLISWYPGSK